MENNIISKVNIFHDIHNPKNVAFYLKNVSEIITIFKITYNSM